MTRVPPVVIVGGGLAGATAAAELRSHCFDGPIVLLGDESEPPYERPPLSKSYLRGESERGEAAVHADSFYSEHEIELRTGTRAREVDLASARVTLDGGERIRFNRLLLATGAAPRRLAVPGANLPGVHHLRTLADCDALKAELRDATRVLVVGAGWIGCEVAASARQLGREVVLVDPAQRPLERVLGEAGAIYADLHAAHGAELRLGDSVDSLQGATGVERATLASGHSIDCDLVVVGIGVEARTELAEGAGLRVGDGVEVDDRLETNARGVFAAGDVASVPHPLFGGRLRVEHWDSAREQGRAAARNMLGPGEHYERVPYFFSDQYETSMEYWGHAGPEDEVLVRGSLGEGRVTAVWLRSELVVAVMAIGAEGLAERAETLIRSRRPVDRNLLRDPDAPLAA